MDIVGDIHSTGIYTKNGYDFYFGALSENQISCENQIYIKKLFSRLSNRQFTWNSGYDLAGNHVFSLTRKVVDTTNMETIGYLILNVDNSYLANILNTANLIDSSGIFISDGYDTIITSNEWYKKMDGTEIGAVLHRVNSGSGYFITNIKHTKLLVAYSTSAYTGWKTVALLPLDKQEAGLIRNQILLLAIGACGILLSVFLSGTLASLILRPIEKLQATMKIAEQGYNVNYRDDTFLETMTLGCSFVKMLKTLRVMTKKAYEGELRKQEAEFKALQAQINPHFLYNTLETINCMLLVDGRFEISKMVVYLGDILRYSVNRNINRVTLKEDMGNVIKYLHIQKLRFGDRIRFDVDITLEAMQCEVLKLLIQPVVENGIVHGLAEKRKDGILRISGFVRESELLITVSDNGIGMDQGRLEQIMRSHSAVSIHNHIGLANVDQRIKLCYGEKYGISVSSQKGKGTVVNMVLPAIKSGGQK
jgi:two-component system sensor histidine kinase YesM